MDINQTLHDNRLFAALEGEERDQLAAIAHGKTYHAGDIVFSAGEAGDSLYLIGSGVVTVVVTEETGEEAEVATLSAGTYFGEMEVVEAGIPRSATIVAREECFLVKFEAAELSGLLDEHDHLAKLFYRTVAKELVRRLRNTTKTMGYYKSRSLAF